MGLSEHTTTTTTEKVIIRTTNSASHASVAKSSKEIVRLQLRSKKSLRFLPFDSARKKAVVCCGLHTIIQTIFFLKEARCDFFYE